MCISTTVMNVYMPSTSRAACLGKAAVFSTHGTWVVSSSQVRSLGLHVMPCGQQCIKSSQHTAWGRGGGGGGERVARVIL